MKTERKARTGQTEDEGGKEHDDQKRTERMSGAMDITMDRKGSMDDQNGETKRKRQRKDRNRKVA